MKRRGRSGETAATGLAAFVISPRRL